MQSILSRITKISIYSLVFLLPLFWLPFSFEAFEFNKQYLLFFLAAIGSLAWLVKMILIDRQLRFRKTPLDIFVGAFFLIAVLSAIFSADRNSSVFGFYGRFSDSLIGLLALGIFYFLVVNNIRENSSPLLKTFLASAGLALLTAYLSIFGVWQKISFLPQVMRQKIFNPVAGSLEGLAVFSSVIAVFLCLSSGARYLRGLLLAGSLGLLLIVDFTPAWLILLLSLTLFLGLAIWKRTFKDKPNRLFLPFALIVLAIFGLSANLSLVKSLAREQVLERGISWQVGFSAATDSVKSGFLGSGPATFHYDFAKEKPSSFNQNRFWQIRFDRPGSHLAEVLGNTGFFGFLSWLALIGAFLLAAWFLRAVSDIASLPILAAFLALFIGQLFYYQNAVLAFSFWLFLALGAGGFPAKEKIFSFKKFPELSLVLNVILLAAGLGVIGAIYFGVRFYSADIAFAKTQYEKAVQFNPAVSQYWTMLSKDYFRQAQAAGEDKDLAQNRIASAIEAGRLAVLRGQGQVAAFENLGMVYRDIQGFVGGSQDWAVKYFREAIKLEPTNPVLRTELAKVLEDSSQAEEELQKAVELKPDYLDALLLQASFEERQGNPEAAVKKIEELNRKFPANVEVLFQLGRAYFNTGRLEEAILQLEKVLILVPEHSNSLYTLGAVYQKKGNKAKAKEYFEKVLQLNPGSEETQKKLDELK